MILADFLKMTPDQLKNYTGKLSLEPQYQLSLSDGEEEINRKLVPTVKKLIEEWNNHAKEVEQISEELKEDKATYKRVQFELRAYLFKIRSLRKIIRLYCKKDMVAEITLPAFLTI